MRYRVLSILLIVASCSTVAGNGDRTAREQDGDALEQRLRHAYVTAYNLDHEAALQELQEVAKLAPDLSTTYRALASITWLRLLSARGTVLVDEYLGRISRRDVQIATPPPELAEAFRAHLAAALARAEQRVAAHPNDPRALYELSSTLGLQASFTATVEGRMGRAFGAARRAYQTAEKALELSPEALEPRLILGTYRYVVAGLSLPARLVAYVAGMDGDRARGVRLVEEAADSDRSEVQTEARFALVLLYNREKRWDDALRVLAQLRSAYPRNRLLWLETGATALRAGRAADAERWLTDGLAMEAADGRPRRMFGERAMWRFKRAQARRQLARWADAREDVLAALAAPDARDWVRGRSHLELAEISIATGDREQARWQIDKALPLLERGHDADGERQARRLLERLRRG